MPAPTAPPKPYGPQARARDNARPAGPEWGEGAPARAGVGFGAEPRLEEVAAGWQGARREHAGRM
jgi:hypothetical protein